MSGMNSGINVNDPTVVAAFKAALVHQGIIALLIFFVLGFAWVAVRAWLPAAEATGTSGGTRVAASPASSAEPSWRQLLRIGFGLLWIFDGILQAQPKMAIGLPSQVIEPTAASSPQWVQHLVNVGGTTWSYHPMQAGASAVWIQVGIGMWMIAASRGPLSRLAGLVSVGWGLVVWVFGESFGGIFAPGLTWLFGAPGAVLIYAVAGGLIALPERAWRSPWPGRAVFGRHWPVPGGHGGAAGLAGPRLLAGHLAPAARHPGQHDQLDGPDPAARLPGVLGERVQRLRRGPWLRGQPVRRGRARDHRRRLRGQCRFPAGQRRLARPAAIALTVVCLADWVLIEDFGFFGGLGTDPNSMIPFVLLTVAGYLALTRRPGDRHRTGQPGVVGGGLAGLGTAGFRARGRGRYEHPVGRRGGRARIDHPRRRADGRCSGQPGRRPDPGRGHQRIQRPAEFQGAQRSASPTSTAARSRWRACAARWCC